MDVLCCVSGWIQRERVRALLGTRLSKEIVVGIKGEVIPNTLMESSFHKRCVTPISVTNLGSTYINARARIRAAVEKHNPSHSCWDPLPMLLRSLYFLLSA
jgi:hypothetical protein